MSLPIEVTPAGVAWTFGPSDLCLQAADTPALRAFTASLVCGSDLPHAAATFIGNCFDDEGLWFSRPMLVASVLMMEPAPRRELVCGVLAYTLSSLQAAARRLAADAQRFSEAGSAILPTPPATPDPAHLSRLQALHADGLRLAAEVQRLEDLNAATLQAIAEFRLRSPAPPTTPPSLPPEATP
jgi:hypothetical protein